MTAEPQTELLRYSGLPPSELPTLEELGLSLGKMVGPSFGRDDQGNRIGTTSGPVFGMLVTLREIIGEQKDRELPADLPADQRRKRIGAAQDEAVDRLIQMLNQAQPDARSHVTREYLGDRRHRFSDEFWLHMADYCRQITGDREVAFRSANHSIPDSVKRLARPFGVEGTYRALGRLANLFLASDMRTVATTPTSATIRWPGQLITDLVPERYRVQAWALYCQAYRGGLAAIPTFVSDLPLARVSQRSCLARGDAYCEWELRWQPQDADLGRRWWLGAAGISAAAAAVSLSRLPGSRLVGAVAAGLLPVVIGRQERRLRRLANEREKEHQLLLEQRELSEIEFANRSQAYIEIQHSNLELEHRVSELTALNEVGRAVAGSVDLDALVRASLEAVVRHGRYQRALVMLHDPERDVLTAGRSAGGSEREAAALAHYEVDLRREGSLLGRIFQSDEPLLLTDMERWADEQSRAFAAQLGATSFLGTPLISQGRRLGVLAVDHGRSGREPDEADKGLLFTIGSLIASAIERAQLYAEIERHSRQLEERVQQRTEDLARASEEAEAARQQAEAANDAKSRFLSNVSHELRTPLTSVLGFAKIIGKRLDEVILPAVDMSEPKRERAVRQVRDNLDIIVTEGERLTTMINNVLDLAKIESGRFEWKDEDVSLPELLERAAAATESLFTAKGLELRREKEDELPIVRGDPDRLLQVVINLLSNAVKFTDAGYVEMKARAQGDEVMVSVTDTGMGIAHEDYATVFEQFRQVGDTLTDKPHGTGLGLPISKEIVEHHGGRLWLDSQPGRGSTFSFSLPVSREGERPAPELAPEVVSSNGSPLVLVADDDRSTRELLRQELESRQYRVLEAVDGRSALTAARSAEPDLIVLDVVMPEPDGFDVAASLKADPQTARIPILILTVLDASDRAERSGAEAFIKKPFDAERLMAEIARLCRQREPAP